MGGTENVVYFCFQVQTESKTTNWGGEVEARAGNPPPALVLSLRVDLAEVSWQGCALPAKHAAATTSHSALFPPPPPLRKPRRTVSLHRPWKRLVRHTHPCWPLFYDLADVECINMLPTFDRTWVERIPLVFKPLRPTASTICLGFFIRFYIHSESTTLLLSESKTNGMARNW